MSDESNLNGRYLRKDLYESEKESQKSMCAAKHQVIDSKVAALEKGQDSINKKITATLVFVIATLVAIVVAIGTKALS